LHLVFIDYCRTWNRKMVLNNLDGKEKNKCFFSELKEFGIEHLV